MKKILLALLVIVSISVTTVFAGGESESATSTKNQEYNVGFIGPMTGDNANYGILCNNSAKLAVDKFNAAGGINGTPVTLITEDSEGNVEKASSSIEKLAESDDILALVGPVFTGPTFNVADRCQYIGLPLITPSATHADITNIGDMIFRTVVSDGLQGEVAGHYFYEVLGYRNLAVLYAKNDYSQGLFQSMSATFESLGGKIVAAETCMVGDKDFKTQLTNIKAEGPDAIYIPNYTVEMAQILEQAAQLKVGAPFLSCDGFSNPDIYNLAGAYTDGVVYVGPAKVKESEAFNKFVAEYNAEYGVQPDSFAINAYDGANIILNAMKNAAANGKVTRQAIRDGILATKNYDGVGGLINFAENGDLIAYQGVYRVNGTTPEYLGSYKVIDGNLELVE
jgi:branched-chain amino acid transport system substrate-binding protein